MPSQAFAAAWTDLYTRSLSHTREGKQERRDRPTTEKHKCRSECMGRPKLTPLLIHLTFAYIVHIETDCWMIPNSPMKKTQRTARNKAEHRRHYLDPKHSNMNSITGFGKTMWICRTFHGGGVLLAEPVETIKTTRDNLGDFPQKKIHLLCILLPSSQWQYRVSDSESLEELHKVQSLAHRRSRSMLNVIIAGDFNLPANIY